MDYSHIPRRMRPKDSVPLPNLALLLILCGVPLACSYLYLPALPVIGTDLGVGRSQLIGTVTYYMLAFSVSTLFAGPLIDMYGRRRPVLIGLFIFILGTVLCCVAPNLTLLMIGRMLQGVGGAVLPVAMRAMLRDMLTDKAFIVMIGWQGIVVGLAPVLAPLIGGVMTPVFGWRSNFILIGGVSFALLVAAWIKMHETHHPRLRIATELQSFVIPMLKVGSNRIFLVVCMTICVIFAFISIFISMTPFMVQDVGWSESGTGFFLLAFSVMTIIGRYAGIYALRYYAEQGVWIAGAAVLGVGGLFLFCTGFLCPHNLYWMIPGLAVFSMGSGMMAPLGNKGAMNAVPGVGGTSAALLLFITVIFQALGSEISSHILDAGISGPCAVGCAALLTGFCVILLARLSRIAFSPDTPIKVSLPTEC